jgi:hypothetical protein
MDFEEAVNALFKVGAAAVEGVGEHAFHALGSED